MGACESAAGPWPSCVRGARQAEADDSVRLLRRFAGGPFVESAPISCCRASHTAAQRLKVRFFRSGLSADRESDERTSAFIDSMSFCCSSIKSRKTIHERGSRQINGVSTRLLERCLFFGRLEHGRALSALYFFRRVLYVRRLFGWIRRSSRVRMVDSASCRSHANPVLP